MKFIDQLIEEYSLRKLDITVEATQCYHPECYHITRVELLPGFKFTGKWGKKWNLLVKVVKLVNGKRGKMLKNRFFKHLLFCRLYSSCDKQIWWLYGVLHL
jgi:hypothetical protein